MVNAKYICTANDNHFAQSDKFDFIAVVCPFCGEVMECVNFEEYELVRVVKRE